MRKPLVAGNWKMNKTVDQARTLVVELLPGLQKFTGVERVLCPPFPSLMPVSAMLVGSGIGVGAQNMHWETSGAYTGEVSPQMVKELCQYVIIGHSERRTYFGETDETVHKKTMAALSTGLIPIVCVGETLNENKANRTAEVVGRQVVDGLKGIIPEIIAQIVIAYEPVWAIGTGLAATGEDAVKVVRNIIRPALAGMYGSDASQAIRILYGGSVTGTNAAEFFGDEIDGALVGGASLKPAEFIKIVETAAR